MLYKKALVFHCAVLEDYLFLMCGKFVHAHLVDSFTGGSDICFLLTCDICRCWHKSINA